jgi:competence protein CoiA
MKFALVNGQRQEAQPSLSGECPVCGSPMIARCGEVRLWHWAHRGRRPCDPWWENETEWHRAWKNLFPVGWQEFVQHDGDGERHIADVRTDDGWVIEFQHSYIKPEERRSREAFYQKLVWVVDGLRRQTDGAQFRKAWDEGRPVGGNSLVRRAFSDACRLLREWAGSPAPAFFDFGEGQNLGWLLAKSPDGPVYVAPFPRAMFVGIHRGTATQNFDSFVEELPELVAKYESHRRAQPLRQDPLQPRMSRRRFRF